MSIPHTGSLAARIRGEVYQFDGDHWSGADPALLAVLNQSSRRCPKTHRSIQEVATAVIRECGLDAESEIVSARNDSWADELPPGAVD
jgi:hypothetical protein